MWKANSSCRWEYSDDDRTRLWKARLNMSLCWIWVSVSTITRKIVTAYRKAAQELFSLVESTILRVLWTSLVCLIVSPLFTWISSCASEARWNISFMSSVYDSLLWPRVIQPFTALNGPYSIFWLQKKRLRAKKPMSQASYFMDYCGGFQMRYQWMDFSFWPFMTGVRHVTELPTFVFSSSCSSFNFFSSFYTVISFLLPF